MKRFLGLLLGFGLIASLSLSSRPAAAAQDETSGDFAVRVLDTVERWRGGTSSPLEDALRVKLERLSAAEQGGSAGGFEAPPDAQEGPRPADDDSQFNALKELMQKMTPLERVKAGVWFLVIRPNTSHRDDVTRMIDQQATALSAAQQAEFSDYMSVRKSLAAASWGKRADRWQAYSKEKANGSFADLAKREVQHIQSLQADASTEKKKGASRFFVKIGIVAIVLALVAVIIFGAAK